MPLSFDPYSSTSTYHWNGTSVSIQGGFVKGTITENNKEESLLLRALSPSPSITVKGSSDTTVNLRLENISLSKIKFGSDITNLKAIDPHTVSLAVSIKQNQVKIIKVELKPDDDLEPNQKTGLIQNEMNKLSGTSDIDHAFNDKEEAKKFEELMTKYKVDTVYLSHIHSFYSFVKDNVRYVITGGAGAELLSQNSFYHYIRAHIMTKENYLEIVELPSPPNQIFESKRSFRTISFASTAFTTIVLSSTQQLLTYNSTKSDNILCQIPSVIPILKATYYSNTSLTSTPHLSSTFEFVIKYDKTALVSKLESLQARAVNATITLSLVGCRTGKSEVKRKLEHLRKKISGPCIFGTIKQLLWRSFF